MQGDTPYRIEHSKQDSNRYSAGDSRKIELQQRISCEIDSEISPPLKDITYRFSEGLAETVYDISKGSKYHTRKQALDYFDRQFIAGGMKKAYGNITQYVRDSFGAKEPGEINNLRRNIYRQIERYGLGDIVDDARPWKPKKLEDRIDDRTYLPSKAVEKTLAGKLSDYKDLIQPKIYDELSNRIREKSPLIAERISGYMPTPTNRLKEIAESTKGIQNYTEARSVFEREVVYDALKAADFDKKKAAKYLGDSLRTLNRRLSELIIERKEESPQMQAQSPTQTPAVNEIERFRQLVMEYNTRREAMAKDTEKKRKKQIKFNANMKIAA
jgi:hypothetical protein